MKMSLCRLPSCLPAGCCHNVCRRDRECETDIERCEEEAKWEER